MILAPWELSVIQRKILKQSFGKHLQTFAGASLSPTTRKCNFPNANRTPQTDLMPFTCRFRSSFPERIEDAHRRGQRAIKIEFKIYPPRGDEYRKSIAVKVSYTYVFWCNFSTKTVLTFKLIKFIIQLLRKNNMLIFDFMFWFTHWFYFLFGLLLSRTAPVCYSLCMSHGLTGNELNADKALSSPIVF